MTDNNGIVPVFQPGICFQGESNSPPPWKFAAGRNFWNKSYFAVRI